MNCRKFLGDQLFDGSKFLGSGKVVITDETGTIQDIVKDEDAGEEISYFPGIISPGLVNAHCHLELSHMKDVIPPHSGLVDFLMAVITKRAGDEPAFIQEQIKAAEQEMFENGIVAVADIANTDDALKVKAGSKLHWYNLVEVLNFFDNTLPARWELCQALLAKHLTLPFPGVLTPHAPYTISTDGLKALNEATAGKVISIHNQESKAENELFEKGTGGFLKLFSNVGFATSPFAVSGRSSLQTYLPFFTNGQTIMLVHNTFISEQDILFAKDHAEKYGLTIAYCLCPNANLYIENTLPPLDLLMKHGCTILLGTDSYSSNWQLSIAKEMQTIQQYFPSCPAETILQWATSNGADVFGWKKLGTLEKGAAPGLVMMKTDPLQKQIFAGEANRII